MKAVVDPDLLASLEKFGVADGAACFNCGTCTAVCSLSSEAAAFPRKLVRYAQLGLREKIMQSPEPWLCYYCGDCSETCPRRANPGEVMMGLRRYLTSRYDWTGISRLFYTSKAFEVLSVLVVAALVGAGFYAFHGPVVTERVALNVLAPNTVVERLDLALLAVLSLLLLSNAYRLFQAVMGNPSPEQRPDSGGRQPSLLHGIPLRVYLQEAKELAFQFLTQSRFAACGTKSQRTQWYVHLLVMSGYSIVFLLVVVGLRWFQTDKLYPLWHPVRLLGYYATFAILYGTTYAILGRLRKSRAAYAHSHASDWTFLILLWLTAFTGIAVHAARLLAMPLATYLLYVIHLMIAVPMLLIEVPFAKWTHQLYRPLVLYLVKVKGNARQS
ncbi:MAG: 4Fe-4S dicluster domain-containing protein [Desulfobacteraceae bacterium]|nr:4Fe-4S dicluster domain-containing protein [Desulfobacteraceae bacterium]